MLLLATILVLHGASLTGSVPGEGGPENITVMFLSPSEVRVSWAASSEPTEKYDVMYKPTDASYRVVVVVAGNSDSVTLTGLKPHTQYQVVVTAVRGGVKFRSRPVVFLTQDAPKSAQETTVQITGGPPAKVHGGISPDPNAPPPYIQVRGVEVGIVCLVLLVWVGAIILFFNRWGKIRMLLPYQPDYKDTQLKVPGSCQQGSSCQAPGSAAFCCSQNSDNPQLRIEDESISTSDDAQKVRTCCDEPSELDDVEDDLEMQRHHRDRRRHRGARRRQRRSYCCSCWPTSSSGSSSSSRRRSSRRSQGPTTPHPRDCNCRFALLHRAEP